MADVFDLRIYKEIRRGLELLDPFINSYVQGKDGSVVVFSSSAVDPDTAAALTKLGWTYEQDDWVYDD